MDREHGSECQDFCFWWGAFEVFGKEGHKRSLGDLNDECQLPQGFG